ncbi:lipopolysaccharide biosynthesis protein [Paratractidigestivibacter sp.]|uniref:lipopolysaccharide biosynthesis protein n=1 Tax=Paratractidigestivibacter sp. TaxID=2847316 RepID=UPI002AC969DF|nr:oligosaccharide flippase family protein [Paratractidigestivibacter sp.]
MSREGALLKNIAVLAIGTFLPKLATFVTLPILTGCLTKEDYGTYDLVIVLVSLFLPAVTLQIQTAAFRFLIDCRDDEKRCCGIISTIFVFAVTLSLVATVIFFFVWQESSTAVKALVCVYFILDIVAEISKQCIRGLGQNLKYSVSAIAGAVVQMALAVVLVLFMGLGFMGSLIALTGSELAIVFYLLFGTGIFRFISLRDCRINLLKELLSYSWPMVPNSMSMWVMRMSNRLLITMFMGVAANAVFAAAYKIPQLITLAQSTFTMAWQESASLTAGDDDKETYYTHMHGLVFDFLAGSAALLIGICPALFALLVRGDYGEGLAQVPILIVGNLFYGMSAYIGGIYVAFLKTKSVGVTTIIAAVINVVIDLTFIPLIGLYAASLALLVSYLFLWVYRMLNVQKFQPMGLDWNRYVVVVLVLVAMVALGQCGDFVPRLANALLGVLVFCVLCRETIASIFKVAVAKIKG